MLIDDIDASSPLSVRGFSSHVTLAWVYVYDQERGWTLEQELTPNYPPETGMQFGSAVDICGDTMILVGCTQLDAWRVDSDWSVRK
jgi:hypothetical protein